MLSRRNLLGDFDQVQVHRLGIAQGQNQAGAFALFGADGSEDIGRGGSLIERGDRPGPALGPTPGKLVLLSDPGLVGEPGLYLIRADASFARDFCQLGEEVFLYASIAPSAWA
jgi:hypothetical protein